MHFCEIKREIGEMKKKCLSREFNRAFSPRPRFFRRWKERIIRNVGRGNGGLYPCPRHRGGIGYCFGPLFPKQTASTLFRQKILCSARQAGRTGNGLLSVLLFVINTGSLSLSSSSVAQLAHNSRRLRIVVSTSKIFSIPLRSERETVRIVTVFIPFPPPLLEYYYSVVTRRNIRSLMKRNDFFLLCSSPFNAESFLIVS